MNNPFRSPVNAHLRKASVLAGLYAEAINSSGSRLTQSALMEGCVFHQHLAFINFLREIGENYQVTNAANLNSLMELKSALDQINKTPAELKEVINLTEQGWLSDLIKTYQSLIQGDNLQANKQKLQVQTHSAGLIQTKQLEENDADFSRIWQWNDYLKELIDRQREMMIEC